MAKKIVLLISSILILALIGCDFNQTNNSKNEIDIAENRGLVFAPTCNHYTASNDTHVIAKRAYINYINVGGWKIKKYYTKFTNEFLGYNGIEVQTVHNYRNAIGWHKGTCPGGKSISIENDYTTQYHDHPYNGIEQAYFGLPEIQYSRKAIATFTTSIPVQATITKAYLTVRRFGTPDYWDEDDIIVIDVKNGHFGNSQYFETVDWGNADGSDADAYSTLTDPIAIISLFDWSHLEYRNSTDFTQNARNAINKSGLTQIRIRVPTGGGLPYSIRIFQDMVLHLTYEY